jgi:ABC-type sugar transport system ATPase subunit
VTALSRRILVLREGRPMGEVARADFSQAGLMRLMAGMGAGGRGAGIGNQWSVISGQ